MQALFKKGHAIHSIGQAAQETCPRTNNHQIITENDVVLGYEDDVMLRRTD